jgi:PAS domain S-box-containing protein
MTLADTILNVDDYEPARYTRSRILRQAGFRVFEAENGERALELVTQERPHLVVLDVNLPDMTGFEVCERIKANPSTASTIVLQLSATSVSLGSKLRSFAAGADAYLAEPLEPEEFLANVAALLRLKKAEEALHDANASLKTIIEAAPLGIVSTDLSGRLTTWNPAAERLFGWASEEVLGQPPPGIPEDRQAQATAAWAATSEGRSVAFETECTRKDGTRVEVRISTAPIRRQNQVTGTLALVEDISQRRRLEREQARLYQEAHNANAAKDAFLAMLSHELRTPLNAIAGWVRLMRTGELDHAAFDHALEVLERNTQAQIKLIEDILDVSRIMGAALTVDMEPLDLAAIVEDAVEAVRPTAAAKGLALDLHVERAPAPARGDRERLLQVVSNLLSNAVKFTAEGSISASLQQRDGFWELKVVDTGIGIRPAFLPHVFERFRQADTRTSRAHGGLGLGLSIVRHLVEAHGGAVTAESAGEGQGAAFTVTIPVATEAPAEAGVVSPGAEHSHALPDLTGISVLVVEDDPDSLELVERLLSLHGATVTTASCVREAFEAMGRSEPDLLVADIGLPEQDGFSFIRTLRGLDRDHPRPIPAIALTGYASAHDRLASARSGFQAHVAKPFDVAHLVRLVGRLARARK